MSHQAVTVIANPRCFVPVTFSQMTLHVAVTAAVLLLIVSVCPTVHEAPTLRKRIAALFRCVARPFTRRPIDRANV
jgi:hypothetical protein